MGWRSGSEVAGDAIPGASYEIIVFLVWEYCFRSGLGTGQPISYRCLDHRRRWRWRLAQGRGMAYVFPHMLAPPSFRDGVEVLSMASLRYFWIGVGEVGEEEVVGHAEVAK